MPSSRSVLNRRTAISPRFATTTLENGATTVFSLHVSARRRASPYASGRGGAGGRALETLFVQALHDVLANGLGAPGGPARRRPLGAGDGRTTRRAARPRPRPLRRRRSVHRRRAGCGTDGSVAVRDGVRRPPPPAPPEPPPEAGRPRAAPE